MSRKNNRLTNPSSNQQIRNFITKVAQTPLVKQKGDRGRLIFALDATASREPTWDQACDLQVKMFDETVKLGGLDIQLSYYRGYGEFKVDEWVHESDVLTERMSNVRCLGGITQIEKVFLHTLDETKIKKVNGLIFIGDCIEENSDRLSDLAGKLGLLGVPIFIFHEGLDSLARTAFQNFARLSNGAYCPFDINSPNQLRELLCAVAVFVAGGHKALENISHKSAAVANLTHQIKRD